MRAAGPAGGGAVIKGLVYLTGLVTLVLAACVVAITHKVHEWPWADYVRNGSELLADTLDPRSDASRRHGGPAELGRREPGPAAPSPRDDRRDSRYQDFARPAPAIRHTVRRGDTLYEIARRYYGDPLKWRGIAEANDIERPSDMRAGRVIVIPSPRRENTSAATVNGRRAGDGRFYDLKLAITPALDGTDPEGTRK